MSGSVALSVWPHVPAFVKAAGHHCTARFSPHPDNQTSSRSTGVEMYNNSSRTCLEMYWVSGRRQVSFSFLFFILLTNMNLHVPQCQSQMSVYTPTRRPWPASSHQETAAWPSQYHCNTPYRSLSPTIADVIIESHENVDQSTFSRDSMMTSASPNHVFLFQIPVIFVWIEPQAGYW